MDIKGLFAVTANSLCFLDTYAFLRKKITKSQVAILLYHRVCPETDNWAFNSISLPNFEQQIQYVSRYYEVISLDELVQCIRNRNALPKKSIVVSLDDGYRDNYTYAYPILKKYKIPATIFLVTGNIRNRSLFWWDKVLYSIKNTNTTQINLSEIGNYYLQTKSDKFRIASLVISRLKKLPEERKNFLIDKLVKQCQINISNNLGNELILTWDEIKEMSNSGISIGAHSVNHPILTNIPLELAKYEIGQSKKDIEENIGIKITSFSYPNGDCNPELVNCVKEIGFSCAVSVSPGMLVGIKDDIYELNRISPPQDINKFKALLCGFWGDLVTVFPINK
jgi:peptidoglycan/xylan/chitin deacetylase (PgdA/CDA1 family)